MTEAECWSRLRSHDLGRVSLVVNGLPHAFPVNYAIGDGSVVFRTDPGAKLETGPGSMSSFEIDGYDETASRGWSVMAFGQLEEITHAEDERSRSLRALPLHPLAPGEKLHWIALHVHHVTGREFTRGWIVPGEFFG